MQLKSKSYKNIIFLSLTLFAQNLFYSDISCATVFSKNGKWPFVEPREVLDRNATPALNSVGMVQVSGESQVPPRNTKQTIPFVPGKQTGQGSGFLINKCLAFTNHHVIFQGRNTKDINLKKIMFYFGEPETGSNQQFRYGTEAKLVAHGDLSHEKAVNDVMPKQSKDWAIIKLNESVIEPDWRMIPKFVPYDLHAFGDRERSFSTASFYTDLTNTKIGFKLWGQKQCYVYAKLHYPRNVKDQNHELGLWATDCASLPGASGSPVYDEIMPGDQNIYAYGIIQGAHDANDGDTVNYQQSLADLSINEMIPFSDMLTDKNKLLTEKGLQQIIKDNPCP